MRYTHPIKKDGDLATDLNIYGDIDNIEVMYKGGCLWKYDVSQDVKHVSMPFWVNLLPTSYHDVSIEVYGNNVKIEMKYILLQDINIRRYLSTLQNPIMYIDILQPPVMDIKLNEFYPD